MKLLAYCILAAADARDAPRAGVDGARVRIVAEGDLAAAVSEVAGLPGAPDIGTLLAYRDVVEAYAAVAAALPLRYGTSFDDEERVRRFLAAERAPLRKALQELTGCVELAVLVPLEEPAPSTPSPPPAGGASSGLSYLAARRAHYARRDQEAEASLAILERCRKAFEGLYVRSSMEARLVPFPAPGFPGTGRRFVSAAFLVDRGRVSAFRERYRTWASTEEAAVTLAGPRAPYSFVSIPFCREAAVAGDSPGLEGP